MARGLRSRYRTGTRGRTGGALALLVLAGAIAGCGSTAAAAPSTSGAAPPPGPHTTSSGVGAPAGPHTASSASASATTTTRPRRPARRRPPAYPRLISAAPLGPVGFHPMISVAGHEPVWLERTAGGAILVSLDQRYLSLRLRSGTVDAGPAGWKWGPEVPTVERSMLLGAFNGGFKLDTGAGGFVSYGRIAVPLRRGLASVVTYANGVSDVGAWDQGVPAPGAKVVSVRQNLNLLINAGQISPTVSCIQCWGATLGGVSAPARSALGVTADGHLIWAGGMSLTPLALAQTLLGAHAVRAMELDINPEWVAFDLYSRPSRFGPLSAVPMVPGQNGVPGQFLAPYSRDFFSIEAR